ncbi:hydrolase [Streptomyces durbertensis]|uniref:Hydrolase n=1 Tax=Streptomyces durbertensis TaxID=2448886 RepID=A0ABR6EA41_9ACTN|nr:hydrolase [Streptomyces durbertensis]MBB1242196.1 hydrolase [Streptomyces durbertensis]
MPVDSMPDTAARAGLLAEAEKVRLLAAERAAEADGRQALDADVVAAVRAAGFSRHLVAARWGGTEGTFRELTAAVIEVGTGCAATAWCASLAAYSARIATHLPEEGQQAVWAAGPDVGIATGLMPAGRATPAADGWRLSGQWDYVSGVDDADWLLLCALVPPSDEAPGAGGQAAGVGTQAPPPARFFALPRGSWTVPRTWDNVGMRATGSHTVLVENAAVPAALSFDRMALLTGRNPASPLPAHNLPLQLVSGLPFVAPATGAALGAWQAAADGVVGRRRTSENEVRLTRAAGRLAAARALVEENAAVADGTERSRALVGRAERNAATAAELLREAMSPLLGCAGTGGLAGGGAFQRHWRDVTTATSHVVLQYETSAARTYTAARLGPTRP